MVQAGQLPSYPAANIFKKVRLARPKQHFYKENAIRSETVNAYLFWEGLSLFHCHSVWPSMKPDNSIS